MNGRVIGVVSLLLVFMAACLISVPVLSGPTDPGEHPWTSDRNTDGSGNKHNVVGQDTLTTASASQAGGTTTTDGTTTSSLLVQVVAQALTTLSWMF